MKELDELDHDGDEGWAGKRNAFNYSGTLEWNNWVTRLFCKGINRMIRLDTILILIPSNMIFTDTSKNSTKRFDTGVYRSIYRL